METASEAAEASDLTLVDASGARNPRGRPIGTMVESDRPCSLRVHRLPSRTTRLRDEVTSMLRILRASRPCTTVDVDGTQNAVQMQS